MSDEFNRGELLSSRDLANILVSRTEVKAEQLEKLASLIDDRRLDVFVFLFNYAPATENQMQSFFNRGTLHRALADLEGMRLIEKRGVQYFVHG